ncbi:hypothetical protein [Arsenicibacter rosenii]|uniref:Uncharacterized protein n=1 Tax=Arsenicibacter rosenii TaxID=1750698 RepID=A0A1S2VH89_9BACT|nr:hypothetical protein [Arsenicibacter rosenii]OIN57615.1 hypothetical protein BLX24_19250 [Arsenicibacter rosenii]
MPENITIHDITILHDLLQVNLVHLLFQLDAAFHIPHLTFDELTSHEKNVFKPFIGNNSLIINNFNPIKLELISHELKFGNKFCLQDLMAFELAAENKSVLLTHVKLVQQEAQARGITVQSISWLIYELYLRDSINKIYACQCLNQLRQINKGISEINWPS